MHLSLNEMTWLCRQSLEGLGWPQASYNYAAEVITWSLATGLMPASQLSHLISDELEPPPSVALDWRAKGTDAGRSLSAELRLPLGTEFGVAQWLMDLLLVKSAQGDSAELLLDGVSSCLPFLYRSLRWHADEIPADLRIEASGDGQRFICLPKRQQWRFEGGATCSPKIGKLAIRYSNSSNTQLGELQFRQSPVVDHQIAADNYQQSIRLGLEIEAEQYQALFAHAAKVLVSSSELSRQGAGA